MMDWVFKLLLPQEWTGIFWILVFIFSGTHIVKIVMRYLVRDLVKKEIYLLSFVFSLIAAPMAWPSESTVPWVFPAIIMGPLINVGYRYSATLIKWKLPGLYAVLNADRRKAHLGGPEGLERRK